MIKDQIANILKKAMEHAKSNFDFPIDSVTNEIGYDNEFFWEYVDKLEELLESGGDKDYCMDATTTSNISADSLTASDIKFAEDLINNGKRNQYNDIIPNLYGTKVMVDEKLKGDDFYFIISQDLFNELKLKMDKEEK